MFFAILQLSILDKRTVFSQFFLYFFSDSTFHKTFGKITLKRALILCGILDIMYVENV